MFLFLFIIFAVFVLMCINHMTDAFCAKKEIPEERQLKLFRTFNMLITLLLAVYYVELFYSV